ncbi:Transcriptional regulatory protein moc3 [Fusarium austroafricanum]|uniref:Transcriptional regulatory protein moc3 n=1 Tax=Fusarium austroafricanum TaxID=2364996 RepID=A0A8H4JRS9_9HYPO|nr:Transcriptional regulatory protein moc3 [Fusarium austroafricanum]
MPDAKLRAKTGCLTCRQRRVKCDEGKPSCRNCSRFGRSCSWPKATDMADRRHRRLRASPGSHISDSNEIGSSPKTDEISHAIIPVLSNRQSLTTINHHPFETDTEVELLYHFYNFYFTSLTLPTKDKAYVRQCQSDLMDMMSQNRTVKRPFRPDFRLDSEFITHAEDLLRSYDNSNPSSSKPSIVLGVPTSLYRLILRIIDSYNVPRSSLLDHLKGLKAELQYWEQLLLDEEDSQSSQDGDSRFNDLMIIATSLLLDLITETLTSQDNTVWPSASIADGDEKPWRWQLDLAMNILQCPKEHQKWSGCYLGAWPLLILGYGSRSVEEITLVKDILRKMQQRIGYGEVQRIREELDEITTYKVPDGRVCQEIFG